MLSKAIPLSPSPFLITAFMLSFTLPALCAAPDTNLIWYTSLRSFEPWESKKLCHLELVHLGLALGT